MVTTQSKMPLWKKTFYISLLLIFLAIGANVWTWDISMFLLFVISVISITMICFFSGELRGNKKNEEKN